MAFEILAKVMADATGFDATMRHIQGSADSAGERLMAGLGSKLAGLFTIGAVEEGLRKVIDYADDIKNLSVRTGIDVEELQKLDYAATLSNSSLASVTKAVERFGIAQAKARAEGAGGKTFEAFQRMGLTPEQIANTEDFVKNFYLAAGHIKNAAIDGQLLADMTTTMGKNARELIPAFKEGFAEAAREAEKLHLVIPEASMLRMAETSDRLKELWFGLRVIMSYIFDLLFKMGDVFASKWGATMQAIIEGANTLIETKNPLKAAQAAGAGWADFYTQHWAKEDAKTKERAEKVRASKEGRLQAEPEDEKAVEAKEKAGKKMDDMRQKMAAADNAESVKVMAIRERMEESSRKARLEGLTDQQKERELRKEIADMQKDLEAGKAYGSLTDLEAAEKEEAISKRQAELKKLTVGKPTQDNWVTDSLAKIGGYGSSASSKMESLAERTAIAAEEIAKNTAVTPADSEYYE